MSVATLGAFGWPGPENLGEFVIRLLAVAGGAAMLGGGLGLGGQLLHPDSPSLPRSRVLLWLAVSSAAVVGALRIGHAAGVDYIAARGMFLGALGGAVLVVFCRRTGPADRLVGRRQCLAAVSRRQPGCAFVGQRQ